MIFYVVSSFMVIHFSRSSCLWLYKLFFCWLLAYNTKRILSPHKAVLQAWLLILHSQFTNQLYVLFTVGFHNSRSSFNSHPPYSFGFGFELLHVLLRNYVLSRKACFKLFMPRYIYTILFNNAVNCESFVSTLTCVRAGTWQNSQKIF